MAKHAIQNKQILQLIESVYDAALDERSWDTLAPQIARAFDSTSATIMVQESDQRHLLTMTENVKASISTYQAYYWKHDIWVERGARLDLAQVRDSREMISDTEFQETEFYRDWLRSQDVFYMIGAICATGRQGLGVLGIHRPRASGIYGKDLKIGVERFYPHLQRALQIRQHLAQATLLQQASLEALDRTATATIVVAADGHIIYANSQAETLLADGSGITVQKGKLSAKCQFDTARLLSLIRSASNMGEAQNEPGGVMAVRQSNALPLTVLVAPFRLTLPGSATPSAIVFIKDPNRSISAISSLQSLFQLTPTEARIAQELANGRSLAEIAASHRASQQTVRKQLKTIFAKTGTNRQAQCVAAILRSIAAIARD